MNGLIGIEGSSYVGKTTVAEKLLEMGFGIVPEYDTFGPFPVSDGSVQGLKGVVDELLDREKRRSELVDPARLNFEDRTPISLITFEGVKGLHAESEERARIHDEVRDYALSRIVQLHESQDIILPNKIAVLRLKDEKEFKRRVQKRGVTAVGELAIFATQLFVAQDSLDHARSLLGASSSAILDVDTKKPLEIAQGLIKFASRAV